MVPSHEGNRQTWKLLTCLTWALSKQRLRQGHTHKEPVLGSDPPGQSGDSETGKEGKPVLLPFRCVIKLVTCGKRGLGPARSL